MTPDPDNSYLRRVVVVDDHGMFSRGLEVLLEDEHSSARVVAWTDDTDDVSRLIDEHEPDLVVVDLKMPKESGIELIRRLRRTRPDLRALVVSADATPQAVAASLSAGAVGFLPKRHDGLEVVAAICAAAAGFHVYSPDVIASVRDNRAVRGAAMVRDRLDDGDRRLWELLCRDDLTNAQVADELHVSVSTLKRSANTLFGKLEVPGRLAAAMLAGRLGLFQAPASSVVGDDDTGA